MAWRDSLLILRESTSPECKYKLCGMITAPIVPTACQPSNAQCMALKNVLARLALAPAEGSHDAALYFEVGKSSTNAMGVEACPELL
eukprot:scaffold95477_cov34-Tisochrysis_lutea.AAC.2